MKRLAMGVLCLLVFSSGCLGYVEPQDVISGRDKVIAPCIIDVSFTGGSGQPDPESDRLGWEDGVWANDTIAIDQSNGLTCAELERVVARTMARVEVIRQLEFQQTPRVEIISRDTFRKQVASGQRDLPENYRVMENTKYEALFMVDEATDAVAVQEGNSAEGVAAFYQPGQNKVVFITENIRQAQIHTGVLAHEFVHALQDQHFSRAMRRSGTLDVEKANLGLIEGDANYVEYHYERRCQAAWAGTCLFPNAVPQDAKQRSRTGLSNVGPYLITYHPYSDGPTFIGHIRAQRGWAGVNALYASPPDSTEQIIHPEKYPHERPRDIRVEDRSTPTWKPVTRVGAPNHETVGEAALFAMFMYPYYASNRTTELIPAAAFRRVNDQGELDGFDPFNYTHRYSAGWGGDKLVAYRNDKGQAGYVWKIAFDSEADAEEFLSGYERVLAFYGGQESGDAQGVWVIPDDEPFGDAFYLERRGDTVLIVNAPSVEQLNDVRTDIDMTR